MGQDVEIRSTARMGEILLIDTDRSFTGQDGQVITREGGGEDVPAELAARLFELDPGIDHVFVLQNTVTVRRPGGWDDHAAAAVERVTNTFLRHYPEGEGPAGEEE
jgi:hypothetical protein